MIRLATSLLLLMLTMAAIPALAQAQDSKMSDITCDEYLTLMSVSGTAEADEESEQAIVLLAIYSIGILDGSLKRPSTQPQVEAFGEAMAVHCVDHTSDSIFTASLAAVKVARKVK